MKQSQRPPQSGSRRWKEVFLTVVTLFVFAVPAAATDWYVDGNAGNDANSCMSGGLAACRSIQAAIDKASAGDRVYVAAASYPESAPGPLTISKRLTLLGAQAGVDARTRTGLMESFVRDSQGTAVMADDVTIDGFTFRESTSAYLGFGVWIAPNHDGTQIINNIFQNNIVGIGLANFGDHQAVIQHNRIEYNNQPGAASGSGIYTDQYVGGRVVKNVLITENDFIGNDNAGIDVSNTDGSGGVYDTDVGNNAFVGNGRGVVLFNTHRMSIHDNNITNSTLLMSAAVRIFDNNTDLSILRNSIDIGVGRGIRMSDISAVQPNQPSSGVVINFNNITLFSQEGLLVELGGHQRTVNAECNWWNSSTGPFSTSNPSGTGEEVVGDADFVPWLNARYPGGACVGLPNTPGKVTGGGQIQSDPIFSLTGDLVSLPAVIPSLAGPTAQATFGFVVQCCAPAGNLEYVDHAMDVRIKAVSIGGLAISSPGNACPAGTGQHATFTGTADVIRATGTTTESFTVDVDDCGEPGAADSFGIRTMTYSNGPSKLIGGNIQIHR
jgi:hypothetical protein